MEATKLALFAAMARNYRSKAMNRDMEGYSFERTFPEITMKDIKAYAEATLDDISRYEKGDGLAPPFIMSRVLYPMFRHVVTLKGLRMNLLRMVHGEQSVAWNNLFRAGQSLRVKMSIRDFVDTPAGELVNVLTRGYVGDDIVSEAVSGFLVRGTGSRPKPAEDVKDVARKEAFRTKIVTREGQQILYGKVSGDKNPIHMSNRFARMAGLPRTIMHGVCLVAMTCNALSDAVLGGDLTRLQGISVRFAKPVFPGDTITLVGYESGEKGTVPFDVFRESGKPALTKGIFRYK
ncbi:MAG TPA: MaoC/PaaZ C-terminal domain-containing protein [Spirochaetota bacterium]|nr:MaoC/PaaZ C-terminal domain-containing protein [Spirochaetota bacterium]HPJ39983.1 MaoC/PaaZ C-terminal domain-containing protein [Spirochaetota bacterium]HPQ53647.1 MaoC/PaaZ C-terminal domain-containing protein [Spirochaetota bacterium]